MTDETTVLPEPAPAPAVAFEPAPAPEPVPAATPPSTGAGRRRRTTGTAGQVIGVVGIVVSLLLAVGVIVGRGWLVEQVDTVATSLQATVARAVPLVDTAQTKISDVQVRVGEAATAAEAIAADPNATPQALQGVLERLNAVSERYLDLRAGYATLREQVMTAISRLELIDRLVPGIDIPRGPVDAITSLDERIQALDAQVMQLIQIGTDLNAVNTAAAAIAEKARGVETLLANVADGLSQVETRLATLQTEIADMAATINTVITVLSLVLVVVLLYLAVLHWVLFRSSRGFAKGPATA